MRPCLSYDCHWVKTFIVIACISEGKSSCLASRTFAILRLGRNSNLKALPPLALSFRLTIFWALIRRLIFACSRFCHTCLFCFFNLYSDRLSRGSGPRTLSFLLWHCLIFAWLASLLHNDYVRQLWLFDFGLFTSSLLALFRGHLFLLRRLSFLSGHFQHFLVFNLYSISSTYTLGYCFCFLQLRSSVYLGSERKLCFAAF